MISIIENEKLPENDQDVIIEDDVWIVANATCIRHCEMIKRGENTPQ